MMLSNAHFAQNPTPLQSQIDADWRASRDRIRAAESLPIVMPVVRKIPPRRPPPTAFELEGVLVGMMLFERTLSHAKPRSPLVSRIVHAVADHYKVDARDIMSDRRLEIVVIPRHVAMYLTKMLTPKSLPAIGLAFRRDHSSAHYAIGKIAALVAADQEVSARMEIIKGAISGGRH